MGTPPNILLISPDSDIVTTFRNLGRQMGGRLQVADSPDIGARIIVRDSFDVVFLQVDVFRRSSSGDGVNGMAFMPTPPVIAFARNGSVSEAVRAIRAGAYDYLPEVPKSFAVFRDLVRTARRSGWPVDGDGLMPFDGFLTEDHRLLAVCRTARRAADSVVPLLIEGETGSGKTLLSRMVHQHSVRSLGPFIEVSCAEQEPSLLARRLLGHPLEDGQSQAAQGGKCTEAEGGTLVLAEVGQTSPGVVLGVLQNLGLTGPLVSGAVSLDGSARLILTSTSPLNQERIRLLFRDSVHVGITPVRLRLPPLRERSVDVPLLAHYFLEHFSAEHRRKVRSIAPGAMRALVRYRWPGNVAELRSMVEERVLLNRCGEVRRQDLPKAIRSCEEPHGSRGDRGLMPLKVALREPERRYILRALEQTGWNKQQAAARLEISRSTLYKKLEEHGIEFDRHSGEHSALSSEECVSILDIALSD